MNKLMKGSLGLLAGGLVAAACSNTVLPQPGGGATKYPIESMTEAWKQPATTPPPGADVPGCKLDANHPYPVVLVAGTTENQADNWGALSPMLANAGYCVFTFNYGQVGNEYGVGEISQSAAELATEVSSVLATTGASKVDIVGHSQGGMMPRYYIKNLGGAAYVHLLIGLTPSNHGTTAGGLASLTKLIGPLLGLSKYPALAEQDAGSTFLQELNAGGDTVPGPSYVVISTTHDEVVTPYTSAFLNGPGVLANVTVQQQCSQDKTGHLGISYDLPALTDVLNWLGQEEIPGYQPVSVNCAASTFGPGI